MTTGIFGLHPKTAISLWLLCGSLVLQASAADPSWPQFRGPAGLGAVVDTNSNPPATWSEQKNITWRTSVPGSGWSSPVIWHDQIWLTTSLNAG
ncbi:MAG: hypothetical protein VB912_01195, partial [Pirellulaceae bacterium]